MRVLALGNFYDSYHSNYDLLGISTDLDFDKLHEYFRQKVKYIDVFLRSEGISFPKNLNEFTFFLEKVSFRQHNCLPPIRRAVNDKTWAPPETAPRALSFIIPLF